MINNKLYLLGGGWDVLGAAQFPFNQRCSVALSIKVPWNETNQPHDIQVEIMNEDGASLVRAEAHLEVGRPPGIRPGQNQRFQMAIDIGLQIETAGTYVIVARIQGQESKRITFSVMQTPGQLP